MRFKWLIGVAIIIVLVIAWILISPLFLDKVVDEDLPPDLMDEMEQVEVLSGNFVDADSFHKSVGSAQVISSDLASILRVENFKVTNGPDLFVYLSVDEQASEFVNLGKLKGNVGNQNYEIPENTDLNKFNKVIIWCRAFGVLFGSADLS